jgi:ATP-dependent RNA helicase HelY
VTDPKRFAHRYPFPLDDFQVRATEALHAGESVLVAAPTGSGKTVVAEFGIERALGRHRKAFYTTPLKALSNQKFGDFAARYGTDRVGLLTGDNSINAEAPIVVMTTEVLRNMLYEGSSTLEGLEVVVMDEVHYLQDPYRGAVWEEILIHLPLSVAVVCLSATVSNAEEFGEWLGALRGPTRVVIEERRPVPLENLYMVGSELHAMHIERQGHPAANPYLVSLDQRELRIRTYRRRGDDRFQAQRISRPREGHRRVYVPRREEVVRRLDEEGMLPAIYFVFSRAGCDASVRYVMESGIRLTSKDERDRILEIADLRTAWIEEQELATLGYYELREALGAGVAAHHAGMLPVFKELVEELFQAGLIRVVFATETLSLGINMPARTVVIEALWKFSGERHEMLTPGEYTQLTGRAGRRGIDEIGYAVVLYQTQVPFERVAGLASTRTYELRSSFRPSYNMAVNLVRNYTREEARHLLNSSFGQFLADRGVVTLERQLERDRAFLDGYRDQMRCDRGDFAEYWSLREEADRIRESARRRRQRSAVEESRTALASLKPGDVVFLPGERRRGLAVVVNSREGRPTVLTQDRRYFRLGTNDLDGHAARPVARIDLPRSGSARSARYRRDLAAKLATLNVHQSRIRRPPPDPKAEARARDLEERAARHPCASCPDLPDHQRWAVRASKLLREVEGLERRIRSRTETLGRQFDRVLAVLGDLGYLQGFRLTEKGDRLRHIYGEGDILVIEAIHEGLFGSLSPSELGALVSALVYESRERVARRPDIPTATLEDRYRRLSRLWANVRRVEDSHQVELCRELDPGFMDTAFAWAEGKPLEDVLEESGMTPGDFVRNCKQLLDLLRQIEEAAGSEIAGVARAAHGGINRSVVAYTGL